MRRRMNAAGSVTAAVVVMAVGLVAAAPAAARRGMKLDVGDYHTCAVKANARVVCWGYDSSGVVSGAPKGRFRSVSSGYLYSCGVRDGRRHRVAFWGYDERAAKGRFRSACGARADGAVVCWGSNEFGQIDVPPGLP